MADYPNTRGRPKKIIQSASSSLDPSSGTISNGPLGESCSHSDTQTLSGKVSLPTLGDFLPPRLLDSSMAVEDMETLGFLEIDEGGQQIRGISSSPIVIAGNPATTVGKFLNPPINNPHIPPSSPHVNTSKDLNAWHENKKFSGNFSKGLTLELIETDDDVVHIEMDDIADEIEFWDNTLVGFVLGGLVNSSTLESFASKNWNHITKPRILAHKKGWFFFKFASKYDMDTTLTGGPWLIGNRYLLLKPWSPSFSFDDDRSTKVPVWVLFHNLDIQFWSAKALSKVTSKLGTHLFTDKCTETKAKISFARVLVEVDVSKKLVHEVKMSTPFSDLKSQAVHYEWVPYYYQFCCKMGHTSSVCRKNLHSF